MNTLHILIYLLVITHELFTATNVIMLPVYVGTPEIEECEHGGEGCIKKIFSDESFSNYTEPFKERIITTFTQYVSTSIVRIFISLFVIWQLTKSNYHSALHLASELDAYALLAFGTCVAYGVLVFSLWETYEVGDTALEVLAILMYAIMVFCQMTHTRAMVHFFPWTRYTFLAYKLLRVFAVIFFIIVEAYSEHLELKSTVIFIVNTLEYLHQAFDIVSEGYEEWMKENKLHVELKKEHADDNYIKFEEKD